MEEIKSHKPGTVSWVDLVTNDPKTTKAFYSKLLGWEAKDQSYGNNQIYTSLLLNGKPIGGIQETTPEQRAMRIPNHWRISITAENTQRILTKVRDYGGKVIHDPAQMPNPGNMGTFTDPDGAMLSVWEPKDMGGLAYKNVPGAFCWAEVGVRNRNKAIDFYENVLGWKAKTEKMGDMMYTTLYNGNEMVGGLYEMGPDMKNMPSAWIPYFEVSKIDDALNIVGKNNASIIVPKNYAEGVGHFAVIQDPKQAVFGLLQPEKK